MRSWTLRLPQPYHLPWTQWYLAAHAVPGVERWRDGIYTRTLCLGGEPVLLSLRLAAHEVGVFVDPAGSHGPEVDRAVRRLLDLDTDGGAVDARLAADVALAASVEEAPGMRVLGVVDGWEMLLRTMIGQQISLAAARTHTARLVAALGEPLAASTSVAEEWRLFPTAAAVAERGGAVLAGPARRVAAVVGAARAVAEGALDLSPGRSPVTLRGDLLALPGVGPWTADYVVMRLAPDPDVLLTKDLVVQQGARILGVDLRNAARWSPFRSYATMHLWRAALAARSPGPI